MVGTAEQVTVPSYPFRVEIEITNRCNLACAYCYVTADSRIEPSFKELQYLFNKTKYEANPFDIVLLGGEPFVRKDIMTILSEATKTFDGDRLGISTNGTLLDKLSAKDLRLLRGLAEKGLNIQVSVDSAIPEINDSTRGKTQDTLSGLQKLNELKIPFGVGIVVTKINESDVLRTLSEFFYRYEFIKYANIEDLEPGPMDPQKYLTYKSSPGAIPSIHAKTDELIAKLGRTDIKIIGRVDYDREQSTLLAAYNFDSCLAGLTRSGVLTDGDVVPCLFLRDSESRLGNLYKESWAAIWEKSRERFERYGGCGSKCLAHNLLRYNTPEQVHRKEKSVS